jgi:hypothetical protein
MKKILLSITMLFIGIAFVFSQVTPPTVTLTNPKGVVKSVSGVAPIVLNDTLYGIFTTQGFYNVVACQVDITKLTGKIGTASKVYLYGSLSGINYNKLDSLTLTNVATNYKMFAPVTSSQYYYFKVWAKIDSTHTGSIQFHYLQRKDFGQ